MIQNTNNSSPKSVYRLAIFSAIRRPVLKVTDNAVDWSVWEAADRDVWEGAERSVFRAVFRIQFMGFPNPREPKHPFLEPFVENIHQIRGVA